jgi:ABC-type transport system involved in cytochrome c biogenesis permease component
MFIGFFFILNTFFALTSASSSVLWVSLFVLTILSLGAKYSDVYGLLSHSDLMVADYLQAKIPLRNLFFLEVLASWAVDLAPSVIALPILLIFFQIPAYFWSSFVLFFSLATLVLNSFSHLFFSAFRNLPLSLCFVLILPFYLPFFLFCLDASSQILNNLSFMFHVLLLGGAWICLCVLGSYFQSLLYKVYL